MNYDNDPSCGGSKRKDCSDMMTVPLQCVSIIVRSMVQNRVRANSIL